MPYLPFFVARNLVDEDLAEGRPWEFAPAAEDLERMRALIKPKRRKWMLQKDAQWHVYTAVRGVIGNARIGSGNAAAGLRGLVADFDMKSSIEVIEGYLNQLPPNFQPNFIETSLGRKARLVWVFERELMVNGNVFCQRIIEAFFKTMKVPSLLPGFDDASYKPTEMWTNGGDWREFNKIPMPWVFVFGVAVDAAKKEDAYASEIPMEILAEEAKKRFPGRWQGAFEVNALGVRFWDDCADCETGAQVKPDGMLCFTGHKSFVNWSEIFGAKWVNEQRALNLSKAAGEIYFDGRKYWECQGGRWHDRVREDVTLALRNRGLASRPARGQTVSDVDKVLDHIQVTNRVVGAAPLINHKPGLAVLDGQRVINTYALRPLEPAPKQDIRPEVDFPWINGFLHGLFDNPQDRPVDYFLAWLQRFYRAQRDYKKALGQALFLCGPKGNGKTLLGIRIIKPLLGDQTSNPYDYFSGLTSFNADLFKSPLLMINDEEAPDDERQKTKFLARIKSFVVNPSHEYHPKFCERINIEWTGRVFVTLNDDPSSVGLLPEINDNTDDKLSFYGSRPFVGKWPEREILEATIRRELPLFARWLLDTYQPPADIMGDARMGVRSYFDRRIARIGKQQHPSHNFLELIHKWIEQSPYWTDGAKDWTGRPYDLFCAMIGITTLEAAARKWDAPRIYRALTTLARLREPGIAHLNDDAGGRIFHLDKTKILTPQPNEIHAR